MGQKISISEKYIAKLLNHDRSGKSCFDMPYKRDKLDEIATVIFQDGKNSSNAKNIHNHLRVSFKVLLGVVHRRRSTNSYDYINTDQKYMLFYVSFGTKMNLPSILFKYLRELVKETRDGSPKPRKWIPLGRLISDVLFERKLVHTLIDVGLTKEVDIDIGKAFNRKNLKNMYLITVVIDTLEALDKSSLASKRMHVEDYPIFIKEDPQ